MSGKKVNTTERVRAIAEPIAKSLGLDVWDVRFLKEGADWYLRVFIEKEGGVSIDDCVNMSHALDKPLDEEDFISQSYILEVSSPGVERELKNAEHYAKSVGKRVKIKTIRPIDGVREFKGVLKSFEGSNLLINLGEREILFNKKELAYIRLDDFGGNE